MSIEGFSRHLFCLLHVTILFSTRLTTYYPPPPPRQRRDSFGSSQQVWYGVTCDICSSRPLTGPRYRCVQCPNFDVCRECYGTARGGCAEHPDGDHNFERVERGEEGGRQGRGDGIGITELQVRGIRGT